MSSFTSQASSSSIMQTCWYHAIATRRLHGSQSHAKNGGVRQMNLGSHVVGKVAWGLGGLQLVSMSSLQASRYAASTSCNGVLEKVTDGRAALAAELQYVRHSFYACYDEKFIFWRHIPWKAFGWLLLSPRWVTRSLKTYLAEMLPRVRSMSPKVLR